MVYASHAYLPFNLPGYATCAYEIYEQLGRGPGAIIVPAGQGGFLLGMARGFEALLLADKIQKMPMMIGVQASACAPLYALWKNGTMNDVVESPTIAEGVRTSLAGARQKLSWRSRVEAEAALCRWMKRLSYPGVTHWHVWGFM